MHGARYLIRLGVSTQTSLLPCHSMEVKRGCSLWFIRKEGMKEGSAFTSVAKSAPFSRSLIPEKIRVAVSNIILGGHRSPGLSPSWFEFYATFLTNSRTNLSSTARWNSRLARGKTRLKMIPSFTHGPAMRRARIHKRRRG